MAKTKKEFVIEFTLLGKHVRTTLYAENETDALEELFKSIRANTKIHFVTKPKNEFNEAMDAGEDLLNTMGMFSSPKQN
jgi:hypothetical protein